MAYKTTPDKLSNSASLIFEPVNLDNKSLSEFLKWQEKESQRAFAFARFQEYIKLAKLSIIIVAMFFLLPHIKDLSPDKLTVLVTLIGSVSGGLLLRKIRNRGSAEDNNSDKEEDKK
jgi:hypothetical protein